MSILQLFNELDEVVAINFSDLDAALATDRGQQVFKQLLSAVNREELRGWYKRVTRLNSLALEIKQKLESELGEAL